MQGTRLYDRWCLACGPKGCLDCTMMCKFCGGTGWVRQCAECSELASDCLCDGGEREPDLDALTEALQEEN